MLRNRAAYLAAGLLACAGVTAALLVGSGAVAQGAPARSTVVVPTNLIPAQIGQSAGLVRPTGLVEIASSSSPLWAGPDFPQTPFATRARTLGLSGGLMQVWVMGAAVRRFGASAVPLPVPLALARASGGPAEVFVRVLRFDNTSSPRLLYLSDAYSRLGPAWSGVTLLHVTGIAGGRVTTIDSAANGGLTEYQFQWTRGSDWVEVSVLGASLTEASAAHLAAEVSA
jgi:hypothetical protein